MLPRIWPTGEPRDTPVPPRRRRPRRVAGPSSYFIGGALGLSLLVARPAVAAPNLLTNPGFESGGLTGWKYIGPPVTPQVVATGTPVNHVAKLNTGSLVQTLTNLTVGHRYRLSGSFKLASGSGAWSDVDLAIVTTPSISELVDVEYSVSGNYNRHAITWTATSTKAAFGMEAEAIHPVGALTATSPRPVYFDNASVTDLGPAVAAPELDPDAAAAGLALALGGLALMDERRRRKTSECES